VFVATRYDPEAGKATEDIVAQPDIATPITEPPHILAGSTTYDIALLPARDCVEQTSYRAALTTARASGSQTFMLHEYNSLVYNGTWELVDLSADRTVVNKIWIYKIESDT
jgi:hypothetical protein